MPQQGAPLFGALRGLLPGGRRPSSPSAPTGLAGGLPGQAMASGVGDPGPPPAPPPARAESPPSAAPNPNWAMAVPPTAEASSAFAPREASPASPSPVSPPSGTPPPGNFLPAAASNGIARRYIATPTMLGHGAWGSVRLVLRVADGARFALKEFKRKPADDEVEDRYERRCAFEFHALTLLRHPNIARAFEFEYDPNLRAAAMVMEIVTGGDLYTAISTNTLTNPREIDCLFVQMVRAVAYMHARGIAHRDLKPENMLWDPATWCLKLIDFGSAEAFAAPLPESGPWDPELHRLQFGSVGDPAQPDTVVAGGRAIKLSRNVVGSAPYIAPEEFLGEGYDARGADVWACAIIYLAMCTRKFPWQCAIKSDARYVRYMTLQYLPVLGRLPQASRKIISRMLQPEPAKRATLDEVMSDWWFRHIDACLPAPDGRSRKHDHLAFAHAQELKRAAAAAAAPQSPSTAAQPSPPAPGPPSPAPPSPMPGLKPMFPPHTASAAPPRDSDDETTLNHPPRHHSNGTSTSTGTGD
ncbi:kinase-like domain-containing protein [Hyaloraphidium curvatum]|nr:kinase-like domain-containing protein [Hyaloraphidium curvatum]